MTEMINTSNGIARAAAAAALLLLPAFPPQARAQAELTCAATTYQLLQACSSEAHADRRVTRAICLNFSDPEDAEECREEIPDAFQEALQECRAQNRARHELCRVPGFAGPYDPEIDPADFVAGIDNPFAPFAVGSKWVYEKQTDEGLERIEIEVLDETREILGVECTVVRDRVWLDGELVEDTVDWLAQDVEGNLWYFGEVSQNFEDGLLRNVDGSWEAGVDGAKPGFWVKAAPQVGEFYRQEWLPAEAEDVVEVLSVDAQENVPFANGNPVLQTRDFTPLEPDAEEHKFYVPGVGLVLELDPESGERLELIEYTP
jgi:hypothetical protein